MPSRTETSRRRLLKAGGALLGASALFGAGTMVGSEPAVAVKQKSLTAADVTGLSSNSGQVTAVTLQPALEYAWNGLDAAPTEAAIEVRADATGVSGPGTSFGDPLLTQTVTDPPQTLEGSDTVSWSSQTDLIADGPFKKKFFRAPSGGRSDNTVTSDPITVGVRATLTTSNGSYQDTASTTFTVEVTNEGVDFGGGNGGGVGGSAGTGGSA